MEKTFFFHTPNMIKWGLPRYTIAGKYENGELIMSIARCSLRDQFSKKIGRTIAEGRLKKGKLEHLVYVRTEQHAENGKFFLSQAIELVKEIDPNWNEINFETTKPLKNELV